MEKHLEKPELRFPGFSGNWEQKKLEEVAIINRGKSKHRPRDADFLYGGKYPFIQTGDIRNANLYLTDFKQTYSEEGLKQSKLWNENTLCITIAANIAETTILKIKACFPDSVIGLIPKKEMTNVLFMKYQFDKFKFDIQKLSQGMAQANLNQEKLSKIEFKFPSMSEQTKIANFLTALDDKLTLLKKKKNLMAQYKKGVMQKLFSQELRFKNENGEDFADWEEHKLREICVVNPKNINLPTTFVYIDLESVVDGLLIKETEIELSTAPSRAQRLLKKGDVLFQMVRPYQKNNLYFDKDGDYVASTGYAQIRTKNSSMFIFQYIHYQNFVDKVIERCTGTSYPAINSTDLSNISIEFPSLSEQIKIGNFLSAIDNKINHCGLQLEKMEGWKKGLLQRMFV